MEQREIDKLVRENESMRCCLVLVKDYALNASLRNWRYWRHDLAMLAMKGLNLNGKGQIR